MSRKKNYLSPSELKYTPEQIALAHQLGSKNKTTSFTAAEAVASVSAAPLLEVIEQAPVFSNQFAKQSYGPGDDPVAVLSPLFDTKQPGYMNVFSTSKAGGLNTNEMTGANEVVVQVHNLSGGASLAKRYLRNQRPRLNVISDALARLAQEVLVKNNLHATNVLMGALANSFIDGNSGNTATSNYQIFRANTAGVFQIDDFNAMMIKYRSIVSSWVGGTPMGVNTDITDMFGSPVWMGQIRSIAYQPQNTRAGSTGTTQSNTSIAATEEVRNKIFNSAGLPSLFDVDLHQYNELGVGAIYNNVFANYATGTYAAYASGSGTTFNSATEQVVVGLNLGWESLISLTQTDVGGAEWSLQADDQFPNRADLIGWFGDISRGYISVDNRDKLGVIF